MINFTSVESHLKSNGYKLFKRVGDKVMYVKEFDEDHANCVLRFRDKDTNEFGVTLIYSVASMPDDPNRFEFIEDEFLNYYRNDKKFISKAFKRLKDKSTRLS